MLSSTYDTAEFKNPIMLVLQQTKIIAHPRNWLKHRDQKISLKAKISGYEK